MKKDPDDSSSAGGIPSYAFARGRRGKYAVPRTDVTTGLGQTVQHVWAPLAEFPWKGSEFRLADDIWIRPAGASEAWSDPRFADFLSNEERKLCKNTAHWLHFIRPVHSELSPLAGINAFLLTLWIVCPSATHVPLRFQKAPAEATASRVLDRFQWIPGYAREDLSDHDLEATAAFLLPLRECYTARRRLRNALTLTFRGCVSVDWQSAFICFAAAAEALLTYSTAPGVTERLARSYAKLTRLPEVEPSDAVARFKRLYSVRSAIVHGRALDRRDSDDNLRDLADFSELLRTIWRTVLSAGPLRMQLELDDEERARVLSDS